MADKTEYEPVDTGEGKKKVIMRQVLLSLALKGCVREWISESECKFFPNAIISIDTN